MNRAIEHQVRVAPLIGCEYCRALESYPDSALLSIISSQSSMAAMMNWTTSPGLRILQSTQARHRRVGLESQFIVPAFSSAPRSMGDHFKWDGLSIIGSARPAAQPSYAFDERSMQIALREALREEGPFPNP